MGLQNEDDRVNSDSEEKISELCQEVFLLSLCLAFYIIITYIPCYKIIGHRWSLAIVPAYKTNPLRRPLHVS